jgi:TolB-like protein
MRCLEKDPSRRPQGAAALLDALDSVLAGGAVAAATTTPSIAVLPFANLSPDPADGFFADGLTDEIITDLSGIKSLRVIARAAMMRYKGTEKEPAAVARELRVRYVLDGSVRRAAASLRLTARLIDADTDTTIWSDKLNGAVEDVFDMQERISRTIVEALRITLTPKEAERLGSRAIEDIQAYETYLQAKQAMWSFTPESLERARKLLEAARARIGENPRLVAALGTVHMHGTEAGFGDPRTQLAAVEDCVRRLNEIDPESVSRYALAGILHWRRGEIREAIATMSRALEIEPNSPDVVAYLQYALLLAGQDERARELSSVLILLDPLTPLFQTMPAFCDLMIGRAEAALPAYQRFVELDPANPIAQYFLLAAQAEAHDLGAMRETAQTLGRTRPDSVLGAFGAMLAREILQRPEARHLVIAPELRAMTR